MKKLLTILFFILCSTAAIHAQGTVTVTQSSDIDAIVNGKKTKTKEQLKAEKKAAKETKKQAPPSVATPTPRSRLQEPVVENIVTPTVPSYTPQPSTDPSSTPRTKLVKKLVKKPHTPTPEELAGESQMVTKRLMHSFRKVRGFRVQVYSGGNTRVAHQEADKAGQKTKMLFPDLPVYVHFYTPRWMCLVGNFTNYRLARRVALKMRQEGYPNAYVIRTMISVKATQVVKRDLTN